MKTGNNSATVCLRGTRKAEMRPDDSQKTNAKKTNAKKMIMFMFFLSGATGLVCQVLWGRILGTIFGNTTYAVSTVLAGFMAGLSLGSRYFGKLIDGKKIDLLGVYSKIAAGIGIYAALTPFIFQGIREIYKLIGTSEVSVITTLVIFSLCFITIVIPTALMGGTLPVLSKYFTQKQAQIDGNFDFNVGMLYSVNTFGAVLGAFLAGYVLILLLGVSGSIYFASAVNIMIALYVNRINSKENRIFSVVNKAKEKTSGFSFVLVVIAISGLTAFVYEVTWTRILSMVLGSSVYAFVTMLCAFLTGIALGSFIYAQLSGKYGKEILYNKVAALGYIQAGIGIFVLLLLPIFGILPFIFLKIFEIAGQNFTGFQAVQFLLAFGVMLLPTTLFGLALPLACSIYKQDRSTAKCGGGEGEAVGNVYAADTLGAIAGTLLAGFLLIPLIGLQKTVTYVALINIILAVVLISFGLKENKLKRGLIISFLLFFSIPYALALPEWDRKIITSGIYQYAPEYLFESSFQPQNETAVWKEKMRRKEVIFYHEGVHFTVSVQKHSEKELLALTIDGKADASNDYDGDMITQVMSGHLPLMLSGDPKRVLVVGLASGVTLGKVTKWPGVEEIDCVELESAMVEASRFFEKWNDKPLEDPRVNVIVNDARNYLMTTDKKYDIIISEPSNPWVSGSAPLFTKEYYKLAKSRLTEDGIFCGWMQLYNITVDDYRIVLNTLKTVFPHTTIWQGAPGDTLLIGTPEELAVNLDSFRNAYEVVREDFSKIKINSVFELLARFIAVPEFSASRINTDNHPVIEFSAGRHLYNSKSFETINRLLEEQRKPVSSYITSFNFNYELGKAYLENGIYAPAYYELKLAVEKSKNKAESYNLLGYLEMLRGDTAQARNYLNRAIELNSSYIAAYINLSQAYYGEGFPVEAADILREAIKKDPQSSLAHHNLGNIYYAQGYYDKAVVQLKKAIERDPKFANPHMHLGIIYLDRKQEYAKALEELLRAINIKKDYADAYWHLARVHEAMGDIQKARRAFSKAAELNPDYLNKLAQIEKLEEALR